MMEPQLEKIKQVQRDAWNKSSSGWKKWDALTMNFFRPMGEEMIRMLQLRHNDQVLDVATGTGEPGLTIAAMLKEGKVTGTDLSEEMLAVATENALRQGIKNFETVCTDASALPFENNIFDAVSCRLGFMFFPDMRAALNEMVRVLKPQGRLSAAVWNVAPKNSWITTSMETMIQRLELQWPPPGAPGLFRCAEAGCMTVMLEQAGLKEISYSEICASLVFDNEEKYWSFITEVASPLAFHKADESLKRLIREEILAKVNQKRINGNIALESNAIVVSGMKT